MKQVIERYTCTMYPPYVPTRAPRKQHGAAMIYALVLILVTTMVVSATQFQVTQQLRGSKNEKYYERALQMAEAGINAYINRLSYGNVTGEPATLMPPLYELPADFPLEIQTFRTRARQNHLPAECFIYYPPGQTEQGFFVGHLATSTASEYQIVAYGWVNGVVRRVKVRAEREIPDIGSVYGLNPLLDEAGYEASIRLHGSSNVVGTWGSEGRVIYSNANNFYDGPVQLVGPNARFYNGTPPPFQASSSNVPSGHPSTADHQHSLANPVVRRLTNPSEIRTADQVANLRTGTSDGIEYFRSHSNNATGMRYLVQNTTSGVVRELPGSYRVMVGDNGTPEDPCDDDWELDTEFSPGATTLTSLGMQTDETFYGIRVYPGDYFFEGISMSNTDRLSLRSYTDAESTTVSHAPAVQDDPSNPNPGQAENKHIRFWIGHSHLSFGDPNSIFDANIAMEYTRYPGRWRVYSTSMGTHTIRGRNTDPAPTFRLNILAYGRDCDGNGYGKVQTESSVYCYGSLVGWNVTIGGSSTVERTEMEAEAEDFPTELHAQKNFYVAKEWTELL